MESVKIIYYETETGKKPFREWLLKLDTFNRSVIDTRLKRVMLGNYGDCKLLKVWELRIDIGSGYRVYFGKDGREIVVLLVGGDKKSQERDIIKAQDYWLDYKGSK
jgi:putative addiction module killer protein